MGKMENREGDGRKTLSWMRSCEDGTRRYQGMDHAKWQAVVLVV
jgi:hypothetical protein